MLQRPYWLTIIRIIVISLSLTTALPAQGVTPLETAETDEVLFGSNYVFTPPNWTNLVTQLGNAVAIYEYVHNTIEFSIYQGSRSISFNTFNAQRGSDVDIASTLIAMLRSQNIPSRYAVGTIQLTKVQLINWLGMNNGGNINVAVQILKDQGIQAVTTTSDSNGNITTVSFEHAWVEALVPFAQYRGLTTGTAIDCSQSYTAVFCNWVPLDASFKQMTYNNLNIDPYSSSNYDVSTQNFDYTGYYNAIANNTTTLLNKNPLIILQEQIASWLRTSYPGKTLEDVADEGQIIQIHDGLLPASLPYPVTSAIRTYDSVALHDAAVASPPTVAAPESKKWAKYVTVTATIAPASLTKNLTGSYTYLLAQLNLQQLTLTTVLQPASTAPLVTLRLGGNATLIISTALAGYTPAYNDLYTITVSMDGAPYYTTGGTDQTISATYNAIIGGYYLIATGGVTSNWTQVNNAAQWLLGQDSVYPIVFNPSQFGSNGLACSAANSVGCTPYVDTNGNGVYQATTTSAFTQDPPLLQSPYALDSLTGGLLYVAATQYFATLHDMFDQADHLMRTKSPIIGFLGVVSTTYGAEYVDSTAFSILPDGLLIDMKGISVDGPYRMNDTPAQNNALNNYSSSQFRFLGHISSSVEHETWQELTGYDAVSTVRGIQMALATPVTPVVSLLNVENIAASTATTLDVTDFHTKLTASSNVPATAYPVGNITAMQNILTSPPTGTWAEYQLPSTLVTSPHNYFQVDILSEYFSTGNENLNAMFFEIQNVAAH